MSGAWFDPETYEPEFKFWVNRAGQTLRVHMDVNEMSMSLSWGAALELSADLYALAVREAMHETSYTAAHDAWCERVHARHESAALQQVYEHRDSCEAQEATDGSEILSDATCPDCGWESGVGTPAEVKGRRKAHQDDTGHSCIVRLWHA
jgi:hypothetical protein